MSLSFGRLSRTAAFILAVTSPAAAMAQAPTVASERALRDLVRVMNLGKMDSLERFVRERFVISGPGSVPPPQRVERLARLHSILGELTLRAVDSIAPTRASGLAQSTRTEAWRRLGVIMDTTPPGRILRVAIAPATAPDAPTRRLTDAELVEQLRAYVDRLARRDVFSGSVLFAKGGKPLFSGAYGEANKDFSVRNTVDTKFNLGSMNKMFTSVAVMQLVEAGKISLDDTLGKFLPAGSMRADVLSKVRVKHLLTHTSGLGSYFSPRWDSLSRSMFRSVDDWMPLVKDETLAFEPGTRWSYSNTGMLLLGKVIEAASGKDYFEYVRERIFEPAGMTSTDSYELDFVTKNLAVGYEREETPAGPRYRNNIFQHVIRGGPAGGGYSTVGDLTRFAAALQEGRLVSREGVKLLTTPKPELSSPEYGFGFGISENGRIVGHSGGFPGINAQLDIYLVDGYTVAVMANYGGGAQPVIEKMRALLLAGRKETAAR
ncbi:MAG TPA: serine hydrolase domain-containing protein [Gemmatimonadaceae bacterium]|nr:serine hydrolase domain-containing protein [Gemmatimonadaceae bacterium]